MAEQTGLVDDHELGEAFGQPARLMRDRFVGGCGVLQAGFQDFRVGPDLQGPGEDGEGSVFGLDQGQKSLDTQLREGPGRGGRDLGEGVAVHQLQQVDEVLGLEGQGALGRQLRAQGDSGWSTVVGVVEDVLQDDFRDDPQPVVYYPLVGPTPGEWRTSSPAYVLKTARAEQIAPEVLALVREVAPEAPMYRVYTMAGLARTSMVNLSFTMLTLAIVSGLALLLGAVGLYGVLSYVVAERTREIGVRMALGAQAAQVRAMVVAQGAWVVGAGILVGVVAALAATRALSSLLFGVRALDPLTFVATSVGMVAVGWLASYLPARRASSVDPIESLKGE